MTIIGLRNAAKALMADFGTMPEDEFNRRFNQLSEQIEAEIAALPPDEYTAMEIEAWIRLLYIRLNGLERDNVPNLHLNRHYITELISLLSSTQLRVLEDEHDFRIDAAPSGAARSMIEVDPAVLAAMLATMHNLSLLRSNTDPQQLCAHFATLMGYNPDEIARHVELDRATGRLKAHVELGDMLKLQRIVQCMLDRINSLISYSLPQQQA
ncbi:MAG: hypothetical protein IJU72_05660 [Bacteroidales bacterium]|nr:hypothetical protein [Bacteroidales bacterium]